MYQVVGIGNALVDSEFAVSDELLASTGLVAGNMTLADSDTQRALFAHLNEENSCAIHQAGGGSGANSLVAFSALGGKSYYHCRVGDDKLGRWYLQNLSDKGVTVNGQFAQTTGTTGTCAVLVDSKGERTMQTHLGVSAQIDGGNVDFKTLIGAKWLYLEGYLAMSPSALPAIKQLRQQAKANHVKIAVSFADPAVVKFAQDGLSTLLGDGVAAIFCNLEEAQLFTGKNPIEDCIKVLLDYADMAVVTAGASDTLIGTKNKGQKNKGQTHLLAVASETVAVVDTNGAGDNYAGAFLYGINEQYPLELCGRLAAAVAGQVVGQFGARLPLSVYQAIKQRVLNDLVK